MGKVVFHVPLFGYVSNFVRTPLAFVLCVGIPAAVFIVGVLISKDCLQSPGAREEGKGAGKRG